MNQLREKTLTRSTKALVLGLLLATLVAGLPVVKPAEAAFPGKNGDIAFMSFRDGNFEIYSMNPNGTEQTNLTNSAAFDLAPAFSPDGKQVAFESDLEGNFDIYAVDSKGSNKQQRLTSDVAFDGEPDWGVVNK